MKKNLLLTVCFLTTFIYPISAQQLLDAGNNWNLIEYFWISSKTDNYSIGSDTIVNGLTYKKVLKNGVSGQNEELITPTIIRETNDGKVYVGNHLYFDTDEILIYDFGLEIMDTFTLSPSTQSNLENKFIVTEIDSVVLLDGDLHRRFALELLNSPFNWTIHWIEGVGEISYGPFYYHVFYAIDIGAELLCAYQEETFEVYQNPQYDTCFLMTTSVEELDLMNSIKIYPNPVQDLLTLEFLAADYSFTEISIFNTQGVTVYHQTNVYDIKEIDTSTLTSGMYYLVLKDQTGARFSQRIVKQ